MALKEHRLGRWKFENGTILNLVFLSSALQQDSIGNVRATEWCNIWYFGATESAYYCVCVCFVFLVIYHTSKANGVLIAAEIVITAWLTL